MKLIMESWRKFVNEPEGNLQELDKGALYVLNNPGTPLATYVAVLKKYAADPEFDKIAAAGEDDGRPDDEVAKVAPATVAAKDLTATQAEIGFGNSLADQVANKYDSTKTALGLNGTPIVMASKSGPVPILVYNGTHILDGHHRWSQIMMVNPDGAVKIDNLTGPAIDNEEEALKVMQFAIAATADKVVTKPFEGENLMQANEQQVKDFVLKNVTDEVLQLLVQAQKIMKPDKQQAADYIAGNLPVIKQSAGRFSREKSMPQAGDSGVSQDAVNQALGTGEINFDSPKPADAYGARPQKKRKAAE
tara:strand:- start:46 stop:960 length:915 start_codon:yes stop_codon:yes gene_type:complete